MPDGSGNDARSVSQIIKTEAWRVSKFIKNHLKGSLVAIGGPLGRSSFLGPLISEPPGCFLRALAAPLGELWVPL